MLSSIHEHNFLRNMTEVWLFKSKGPVMNVTEGVVVIVDTIGELFSLGYRSLPL